MGQCQAEVEFKMERVVPYFQPIMNLNNHRVWRYECLARLLGDKDHIFLPSEFLTIVEEKNWNADLTHHIYEQSRRYCVRRNMPWSINLSDSDLKDETLVAWLIHLNQNVQSTLFGIEISYESLRKYFPVVAHLRDKCPYLAIIIDDVPSDCELLSRALQLKIQAVKLSSDLINETAAEKSHLLTLVDLCRANNTKLIVEHIENKETLLLALSIGIEYGQGFYLSLPSASV